MTASIALSSPKERITEKQYVELKEVVNSKHNPITYLAVDPGKSNGVCTYNSDYQLMAMLTIRSDDINFFIHQFEHIITCVVENFSLFPNKAKEQVYSDMETSRVIGRLESWAEIKKIQLVKQSPTIKPTAYLWLGKKPLPKSNPRNHLMDAHAHFTYWAVKTGRIKGETLLKGI